MPRVRSTRLSRPEYEKLMKEAEANLAVMAATFIEVPQFRLAGAPRKPFARSASG